jgi:palmitoyl-protein thioesterase
MLWVVLLIGIVAAAPAQQPLDKPLKEGMQLLTQSGIGQYEGEEDHISLEYKTMREITSTVSVVNMSAILVDQDKRYDAQLSQMQASPYFGLNVSCNMAPDCSALNRHNCEATENTCGTCKEGYFGAFGDSNETCTTTDCSRVPSCAALNREACGRGLPNTCGPCLPGFHDRNSKWVPDELQLEDSNTLCMVARFRPVVFVHGLGDIYNGPGMSYLTSSVKNEFHFIRTFSAEPGGSIFSMAKPFPLMVEDFVKQVQSIPSLKDGFNLIGVSQGGLIARAYVEKFNDPPVYNLISLHGPQSGIAMCPGPQGLTSLPCEYAMHWALATPHDYWRGRDFRGVHDKETYLKWNTYLQDMNNEGDHYNQTYVDNMLSLNKYVLIKALNDRVVVPSESEWHGYFEWGNMEKVLPMEETEEYQQDRIGLKTLNDSGRLMKLTTPGPHVHTTRDFWEREMFPLLDNGWFQDGTPFDLGAELRAFARRVSN